MTGDGFVCTPPNDAITPCQKPCLGTSHQAGNLKPHGAVSAHMLTTMATMDGSASPALAKQDHTLAGAIRSDLLAPADMKYPASYAHTEPLTAPHTVTVLAATVVLLYYVAFSDSEPTTTERNLPMCVSAETPASPSIHTSSLHSGLLAGGFFITVFCAEHLRDTLLLRPHPAFWRWILGCGLLYAAVMAFALFQNLDDLRQWVRYLDPARIKGVNPLGEKS